MVVTDRPSVERPGKYVGQTLNQIRHGQGRYLYHNTFFSYDGTWVEGTKHGKGELKMRDGGYYKGEFCNGEITGKGERYWPATGNIYVGEFDQGELCGSGQMKYADGRRYTGQWCDNKYEGKGTLHSGDGDIYNGNFHLHKRHGDGHQVWADGTSFEGGWVSNKPHGHGTMRYAEGSKYDGQFYHGLRQGQGTYEHVTGITYSGIWIQDEIPPEEFANSMAVVGSTEIEIYQGDCFSIEVAVLHINGNVMEGDTGRQLDARIGLLAPLAGDKSSKIKTELNVETFETPFGEVKTAGLAEVNTRYCPPDDFKEVSEKERPSSRGGYDYVGLDTPEPTETIQRTNCGHSSWARLTIPAINLERRSLKGHNMIETVESDDDEAEIAEETKPKGKKKGKSSPATARKDRSSTPDDRDRWKKEGPRAERDRDLHVKYGAPGSYVIKICDVTEPKFFENVLDPIYIKVNILKVRKSSTRYLLPRSPSLSKKM